MRSDVVMLQVLRDFRSGAAIGRELGDATMLHDETANFRKRCSQFLKDGAGDGGPARKRHRVKSMEVLLAIDNAMYFGLGRSLKDFQIDPGTDTRPPIDWPVFRLSGDQGSDMLCASHYGMFGPFKLNLDRTDDLSHGCWNDAKLAIKAAGGWRLVLLSGLAFNTPHGPWEDGTKHLEVSQAPVAFTHAVARRRIPHVIADLVATRRLAWALPGPRAWSG